MNRLEDISQNVDFGPKKGQILTEKGPKWTGLDFSRTVNINFPKEDHKISFYTKNQQNSMNYLEDISQNVDFGPERDQQVRLVMVPCHCPNLKFTNLKIFKNISKVLNLQTFISKQH